MRNVAIKPLLRRNKRFDPLGHHVKITGEIGHFIAATPDLIGNPR